MKADCQLAIIINSYNRLALLKTCLGVLSGWLPKSMYKDNYRVIVFDAGSTDGSLEWLEEEAWKADGLLVLLEPEEGTDRCFAAGVNAGAAYAITHFPAVNYLLFYETDNLILDERPLLQAIALLNSMEQLGACGFTVRKIDGRRAGVGQPFPTLVNFALGKQLVERFGLERIPYRWHHPVADCDFSFVDVVYTSPLIVRADAWSATGGMDEKHFPFADSDIDWARRLRDLGWRSGVIKTTAVIHDNQQILSGWSKARSMQSHAGRLQYFKIHHPRMIYAVWPVLLLLRHLLELFTAIFIVRKQHRRRQLSAQFISLIRYCCTGYHSR